MDFVEQLIFEQRNANGLLLDILTSDYSSSDYIVAVEGVDDYEFFFDYLSEYLKGNSFRILICGNKDAVLGLRKVVDTYAWVERPKFAYLCDKDFDDFLEKTEEGIWYTPGYSIENFMLCSDYVRYVVQKFDPRAKKTEELDLIQTHFENEFNEICYSLVPFLSYLCEIRALGLHPAFDEFGIDKLFNLRDGMKRLGNRMRRSKAVWGLSQTPSFACILRRTRTMRGADQSVWLRGKLGLQIAKKSYERIRRSLPRKIVSKMPQDARFARDAAGSLRGFLQDIPSLRVYLTAL